MLVDTPGRRGEHGGYGVTATRLRLCSGARGRESRGGVRGRERVRGFQGARGAARDVQGKEEAARKGGSGRRVVARAGHAPLPTGARRKAIEGCGGGLGRPATVPGRLVG